MLRSRLAKIIEISRVEVEATTLVKSGNYGGHSTFPQRSISTGFEIQRLDIHSHLRKFLDVGLMWMKIAILY